MYLTDEALFKTSSIWQRFVNRRLARRNQSQASMNYLDRGMTCLSGRTAAYLSDILQSPTFLQSFTRDFWPGIYLLDAGDNTFCTRWLISKGWQIQIHTASEAEIYTVVLASSLFLTQVLRWARNSKGSSVRCLLGIPEIWRFVERSFLAL